MLKKTIKNYRISRILNVTLLYFGCSYGLSAQNPGGVSGSVIWMKANNASSLSFVGGGVSSWSSSQTALSVNLTQGSASRRPTLRDGSGAPGPLSTNMFNYNPYVFFDGTNDYLFSTTSYDFGNCTALGAGTTQFSIFGYESGIVVYEWNGPNGTVKSKGDGNQCVTDGVGSFGFNNQLAIPYTYQGQISYISGLSNGVSGGYNQIPITTLSANNNPSGFTADRTSIGANVNVGEFFRGGVSEIVQFPSMISAANLLRVNSYLAIKNGATLGNASSLSPYVASNGTVIWNSSLPLSAQYQNQIIGIGRDDASGLVQRQSHTFDDSTRIYIATLSSTNLLNGGVFSNDGSFVLIGDNRGRLCSTTASLLEKPVGLTNCALYSRLEREWKVLKSNMNGSFSMDVKLAPCANQGSVNAADLRFLVDDDGDFSNGGTQCFYNGDGTGIVLSYSNPVVTISNIDITHIPNGLTKYVTIGSSSVFTPLPVELSSFEARLVAANSVDLSWKTFSEINNDYFTVYRSTDGVVWEELTKVKGAGTSLTTLDYSYQDDRPELGQNFYKLSQTDFDGIVKQSELRMINYISSEYYEIYPNPGIDIITVSGPDEFKLTVFNQMGEPVGSYLNITEVNVSSLDNGLYFFRFDDKLRSTILKFVKTNKQE